MLVEASGRAQTEDNYVKTQNSNHQGLLFEMRNILVLCQSIEDNLYIHHEVSHPKRQLIKTVSSRSLTTTPNLVHI